MAKAHRIPRGRRKTKRRLPDDTHSIGYMLGMAIGWDFLPISVRIMGERLNVSPKMLDNYVKGARYIYKGKRVATHEVLHRPSADWITERIPLFAELCPERWKKYGPTLLAMRETLSPHPTRRKPPGTMRFSIALGAMLDWNNPATKPGEIAAALHTSLPVLSALIHSDEYNRQRQPTQDWVWESWPILRRLSGENWYATVMALAEISNDLRPRGSRKYDFVARTELDFRKAAASIFRSNAPNHWRKAHLRHHNNHLLHGNKEIPLTLFADAAGELLRRKDAPLSPRDAARLAHMFPAAAPKAAP